MWESGLEPAKALSHQISHQYQGSHVWSFEFSHETGPFDHSGPPTPSLIFFYLFKMFYFINKNL